MSAISYTHHLKNLRASHGSDRVSMTRPEKAYKKYARKPPPGPDPSRPVRFPTPPGPIRLDPRIFAEAPRNPTRGSGHDPREKLDYISTGKETQQYEYSHLYALRARSCLRVCVSRGKSYPSCSDF